MTNFVITFVVLFLFISILHRDDDRVWLRALIIAAVLVAIGAVTQKYGIPGWAIGGIIGMLIVMRVMNYSLGAAFFFIIVSDTLQILSRLGIERYLP